MIIRVFTGLFVSFLSATAFAAPLWQNVESGMTASQVRLAQPDAQIDANPTRLGGGATCDLSIPSLDVGGDAYKVCFFMLDGKLLEVMLTALEPTQPMFDSTIELLRGKYGTELAGGHPLCTMIGIMKNCEANWLLKSGVNISALLIKIDDMETMNIVYQTRMAKDASKL